MKRSPSSLILQFIFFAFFSALLFGCGSSSDSAQNTTLGTNPLGTPEVGTHDLRSFFPIRASSFSDGFAAFGFDKGETLAMMRPLENASWDMVSIGNSSRFPTDEAELGSTWVIVGKTFLSDDTNDKVYKPFVAVASEDTDGLFRPEDLGQTLFDGMSSVLNGIALTGDPQAEDTKFMMVGSTATSRVESSSTTVPVAFTSADGYNWQSTTKLPMPEGVTWASAEAITYAPSGTAYPGIVVVGTGFTGDAQIGQHYVVILWQTSDGGKTWNIISDDGFDEQGRNLYSTFIEADNHTIVIAGYGDIQGGTPGQVGAIAWAISSDGSVSSSIDTLDPNRCSISSTLSSAHLGGFLTATQIYDCEVGYTQPFLAPHGSPVASVWSSSDGIDWTDVTNSVQGIDSAFVISGIAEFDGRTAFFGVDLTRVSKAYIVDSPTLK